AVTAAPHAQTAGKTGAAAQAETAGKAEAAGKAEEAARQAEARPGPVTPKDDGPDAWSGAAVRPDPGWLR
ncbi:hypothetical protein AB0J52_29930, partial [Spirillospora sp. NPDC049652]